MGRGQRPTCQEDDISLLQGSAAFLPDVEGVPAAQQPPCHPGQKAGYTQGLHSSPVGPDKTEVSVAKALPSPNGARGLRTRNVIVKAGLRLLTEACRQVLGAAGPGSPAPEGAFWPGSRSPHSAEPEARGGAQKANPELPSAPKIKAPVLTQGEVMLPGRGSQPRMRSNSPAGGMPGECPEAGAPHIEAPRLLQRG